jgi:hypothetical protein
MSVQLLLDGSLEVEIYFYDDGEGYEDNIYLSFSENCPDEQKVFKVDSTQLNITPSQATHLIEALTNAIQESKVGSE